MFSFNLFHIFFHRFLSILQIPCQTLSLDKIFWAQSRIRTGACQFCRLICYHFTIWAYLYPRRNSNPQTFSFVAKCSSNWATRAFCGPDANRTRVTGIGILRFSAKLRDHRGYVRIWTWKDTFLGCPYSVGALAVHSFASHIHFWAPGRIRTDTFAIPRQCTQPLNTTGAYISVFYVTIQ